jgi:hypothetical protein
MPDNLIRVQLSPVQLRFIYSFIFLCLNDSDMYLIIEKKCSVFFKDKILPNDILADLNCLKNELSLLL